MIQYEDKALDFITAMIKSVMSLGGLVGISEQDNSGISWLRIAWHNVQQHKSFVMNLVLQRSTIFQTTICMLKTSQQGEAGEFILNSVRSSKPSWLEWARSGVIHSGVAIKLP